MRNLNKLSFFTTEVKKEEKKPVEGQKKIAELLRVGPPQTDKECFVHCIDFVNLCGNGRLGFISSKCVPQVSLAGDVNISEKGQVNLDQCKMEQVRAFHRHVFEDVILVPKFDFDWDFETPLSGLLIVPLLASGSINFDLIDRIRTTQEHPNHFQFEPARFVDTVVTLWSDHKKPFYVERIADHVSKMVYFNECLCYKKE